MDTGQGNRCDEVLLATHYPTDTYGSFFAEHHRRRYEHLLGKVRDTHRRGWHPETLLAGAEHLRTALVRGNGAILRGMSFCGALQFATYLCLVGAQAGVFYLLSRCGVVSVGNYVVHAALPLWSRGAHGVLRSGGVLVCFARGCGRCPDSVGMSAGDDRQPAGRRVHLRSPPPPENGRRAVAAYLLENDVRYGYADFWDAYVITFLTNEKVILASTSVAYISEYQQIVNANAESSPFLVETLHGS